MYKNINTDDANKMILTRDMVFIKYTFKIIHNKKTTIEPQV